MRDLVLAQKLAAEAAMDHSRTLGGARYVLHGSGGQSGVRLSVGIQNIIQERFPYCIIGGPKTTTKTGKPLVVEGKHLQQSKKVHGVLGLPRMRTLKESVVDTVESSVALGLVELVLQSKL